MLQQAVSREAYAAGVPSWVNKARKLNRDMPRQNVNQGICSSA